jgi:hypothetical protein
MNVGCKVNVSESFPYLKSTVEQKNDSLQSSARKGKRVGEVDH